VLFLLLRFGTLLCRTPSNGRGLFLVRLRLRPTRHVVPRKLDTRTPSPVTQAGLERSEIDKKGPVRQNSTRDAQSQNIKRAHFERILLNVVVEGRARLSVRQSGRFDGMNLGHSCAPYVLGHVDCVLALVIPICSRDLDPKYTMEQLKLYAGWWPACTSRSARSGRP
jgi:hypothetical protein